MSLDLPIWIDAICISQLDDDEKSEQVGQMGDIYRRAHKVVVWLGPAGEDSDLAMVGLERSSLYLPGINLPPRKEELSKHGIPDVGSPVWLALGCLYRRKWFGRLWTFQEIMLAAEILMICGQKTAEWTKFAAVATELNRLKLVNLCVGYQSIVDGSGFYTMRWVKFARGFGSLWRRSSSSSLVY